jgi:hypothetical protein
MKKSKRIGATVLIAFLACLAIAVASATPAAAEKKPKIVQLTVNDYWDGYYVCRLYFEPPLTYVDMGNYLYYPETIEVYIDGVRAEIPQEGFAETPLGWFDLLIPEFDNPIRIQAVVVNRETGERTDFVPLTVPKLELGETYYWTDD